MSVPRIVPCLDIREGRVVKGVRFRHLRDAGDPVAAATRYAATGADEIVLLDVSATREERLATREVVAAVRAVLALPLTVGGGIGRPEDAEALLAAGADKIAVNSAALARPELVDALARRFGSSCIVTAVDAERVDGGYRPRTHGGTCPKPRDAIAWCREAADRGAGEILLTSFDRDGTRTGFDLELLAATSGAIDVPLIASGGGATPEHFAAAFAAGADAALAASIFHDGDTTPRKLKTALEAHGLEFRPC